MQVFASVEDMFIQRAAALRLAQRPAWLALLHYKPEAISRRVASQADDDAFFLSDRGRTLAGAELKANIRAFLQPAAEGYAQCRFPARWHWLKQQLDIGNGYDVSCPGFQRWFDALAKDRLVLVFPSMYLNNPGSMFGHTFLRFDDADGEILLSHALNYSASYDPEDDGITYVLNGVFGGYRGVFSMRRYFETVQAYSNIENRDIWEYQLDLSREEIEQLLRHVWEVTNINFDYYFFRENCSYRLLGLIETVRPEAARNAAWNFPLYAIPVDTVRALGRADMIVDRQYRPSLASQIQAWFDTMTRNEADLVLELVRSDEALIELAGSGFDEAQQAKILNQAYTLLEFEQKQDTARANSLLSARSKLRSAENIAVVPPASPETGHRSARFTAGAGRRNDLDYIELSIRPGFHDLVDAVEGYVKGAEINVLDTSLRWFNDSNELRLERLRFFNIVSLNPVRRWYKPVSWQLDVLLDRTQLNNTSDTLAFVTRGGAGISTDWGFFAMAMLEGNVSGRYDKGYSLYAGLLLGGVIDITVGRLLLTFETDEVVAGFDNPKDTAQIELQLDINADTAIRFGYRKIEYPAFDDTDWYGRVQFYF